MNPQIETEIRRVFGNRLSEAQPFKRGSAGIEGFARLMPLIERRSGDEARRGLLPSIESLMPIVQPCHSCHAKLLADAHRFTRGGLPDQARRFAAADRKLTAPQRDDKPPRDFRAEVDREIAEHGGRR